MESNEPPGLTVATSLSTASSSSSALQTPQGTLKDFCQSKEFTPPNKAELLTMPYAEKMVDYLLYPMQKTWNDLTAQDQVKLSFLILRNAHTSLLAGGTPTTQTAQALLVALDETTFYGKRLNAFVRKGGDIMVKDNGEIASAAPFTEFLRLHPQFEDAREAPTIFNHPQHFKRVMKPLIWLQEESSMVCYLVSVAIAIFYSQCMHNGTTPDDAPVAIGLNALNVSRFMRDAFTDQEVYENIFLRSGGYPDNMIDRLLKPHNPGKRLFRAIDLRLTESVDVVFAGVRHDIRKYGALVIEAFKTFPDFDEDNGKLVFHGNWEEKQKYRTENLHALLIIGVRRTSSDEGMGGLAFVAQNSSEKKPFVIIGRDLLHSMGIEEVLALEVGLQFDTGSWNHDTANAALIQSGSPRDSYAYDGHQAPTFSPSVGTESGSPRDSDAYAGKQARSFSPSVGTEDDLEASATVSSLGHYWEPIDLDKLKHKYT